MISLKLRMFAVAILAFLGVFTATALASSVATTVAAPEGNFSLNDLMKPVYDAFVSGQYLAAGMLALVMCVALLKRYAPAKYGISDFVHGDAGGAVMTLVGSFAGAMGTALLGGGAFSFGMFKAAGLIAVGAAGGYALIKKLVIEPFIRPWSLKAPVWLKPILGMVLWVFDKPSPIARAEAVGQKAVDAIKDGGTVTIVGAPKDVE